MRVKILAEIIAEVNVIPDDVINSDTIGDYKSELDCAVGNDALHYLCDKLPYATDIEILSAEPWGDGVEAYGELLNNWRPEYERKMSKYRE